MAQRKVPVDEGYPWICNTPAKFRPKLSLRLVGTAKVDYLDGGEKNKFELYEARIVQKSAQPIFLRQNNHT